MSTSKAKRQFDPKENAWSQGEYWKSRQTYTACLDKTRLHHKNHILMGAMVHRSKTSAWSATKRDAHRDLKVYAMPRDMASDKADLP